MVAIMDVEFRERGEGWRRRGRPPRAVPDEVLDLVCRSYELRADGAIPVRGATRKEVLEVVALLKRGAEQLGWRAHVQYDAEEIRFYVEGPE